jgi:hypothetical protein
MTAEPEALTAKAEAGPHDNSVRTALAGRDVTKTMEHSGFGN